MINETKIDKNVHDDLVSIDGYTIKRCDCNRNGGGVAVYIKDTLFDKCTVRNDLPKSMLEALCIEIKPVLPKSSDHDCLNADLLPHSKRLTEIYKRFCFHQLIKTAMRETLISSTLIGHIATSNKSNIVVSGVHQTSVSDHYLVV